MDVQVTTCHNEVVLFLNKVLESFRKNVKDTWKNYNTDEKVPVKEIEDLLKEYKNLKNVDKISNAQSKIDETKIILHDNVKKLLER